MAVQRSETPLSEERRKEIFLALVEAQDSNLTVAQSHAAIKERFGISQSQLRQIESEGVDHDWPPL